MQYRLLINYVRGAKAGQQEMFPLPKSEGEIKIGRDPSCGIRFDANSDTAVSRHHASIHWHDDEETGQRSFELVDLVSSNGTFVNGQRVEFGKFLTDGDVLEFSRRGPSIRLHIVNDDEETRRNTPKTDTIPKVEWPLDKA